MEAHLRRKITLCNQMAFSIGIAMVFATVSNFFLGVRLLAPFMFVAGVLYLLVILMNRWGYYNFSRLYLNALPPLLIVLISGTVLSDDVSFKFALISVILVPVLLFGITEPRKMGMGILWVVLVFLTMDFITPMIPKAPGIEISAAVNSLNIAINGLVSFFMFSVSFIYFQRLNLKAESELSETLQKVQAQKAIIEQQAQDERVQADLALSKQMEVNALKSTFVAMTSHEFRTPLTSILSSEELLRHYADRLPAGERDALFVNIETAVRRMIAMLDKMLIIGRADADLLEFKPVATDLAKLCRALLDETHSANGNTDAARLVLRMDEADEIALVDEKLLRHSLGNLLSNAVKYSPEGGEVALVVLRRSGVIVFEVTDQGIGIPAADLPRLFESFHRASNVGSIGGTGLGLAIVKRAVECHGGSIDVHSQPGRGTRFCVTIPQN